MTDQDPTQQFTPPPEPPPRRPAGRRAAAAAAARAAPAAPQRRAATAPVAAAAPRPRLRRPRRPPARRPAPCRRSCRPRPRATPSRPRPSSRPRRRRSAGARVKWVVALVVVALVAVAAAAGAVLLTGASGTPSVLAWTPNDSVTYAEVRLDLPGNQQAELAKVLSAFPGFDDQAAFPTKINEVLDQLVGKASDGKQSYTADIAAVVRRPARRQRRTPADRGRRLVGAIPRPRERQGRGQGHGLGRRPRSRRPGATSTTETYNGVTITVIKPPADVSAMAKEVQLAYAVDRPGARHRRHRPPSRRPSTPAARPASTPTSSSRPPRRRSPATGSPSPTSTPRRIVDRGVRDGPGRRRDADRRAVGPRRAVPATGRSSRSRRRTARSSSSRASLTTRSSAPRPTRRRPCRRWSRPTPSPSSTRQDFGGALKRLKALLASDASLKDGVQQVDDALKLVGGFDAAVGWMGESGIAITNTNGDGRRRDRRRPDRARPTPSGCSPSCAGSSSSRPADPGIKLTDESYNGATITTVDLSGIGALAGGRGRGRRSRAGCSSRTP